MAVVILHESHVIIGYVDMQKKKNWNLIGHGGGGIWDVTVAGNPATLFISRGGGVIWDIMATGSPATIFIGHGGGVIWDVPSARSPVTIFIV